MTIRTFRISGIGRDVTKEEFHARLADLYGLSVSGGQNDLITSLSPKNIGSPQIATVTFLDSEPAEFQICQPGRRVQGVDINGIGNDMVIDCDFFGMTPLFSDKNPQVDIVAVSGLGGHAFGSWKSPTRGSRMWLRDFLPVDLSQRSRVRILTFGYDSAIIETTSTSSIKQFARNLLDGVNGVRSQEAAKRRPIVFIGHSLGGLVIKQALVDAGLFSCSSDDQAILNSCAGLFLFGVPNKGLNNQNMLSMVKGQKNEHLIHDLGSDSALLSYAYEDFLNSSQHLKCRIVSFYETHDTPTRVFNTDSNKWESKGEKIRMVSMSSATWASQNERPSDRIPIHTDHSKMVKFMDQYDQYYEVVRDRIASCVEEAAMIIENQIARVSGNNSTVPNTTDSSNSSQSRAALTSDRTTVLVAPAASQPPQDFQARIVECDRQIQSNQQRFKINGEKIDIKCKQLAAEKTPEKKKEIQKEIEELRNRRKGLQESRKNTQKSKENLQKKLKESRK